MGRLLPTPQCFIRSPIQDVFQPIPEAGPAMFGSYLVYDTVKKVVVRTGKANDLRYRVQAHTRDKEKHNVQSAFYDAYRVRWHQLEWY